MSMRVMRIEMMLLQLVQRCIIGKGGVVGRITIISAVIIPCKVVGWNWNRVRTFNGHGNGLGYGNGHRVRYGNWVGDWNRIWHRNCLFEGENLSQIVARESIISTASSSKLTQFRLIISLTQGPVSFQMIDYVLLLLVLVLE